MLSLWNWIAGPRRQWCVLVLCVASIHVPATRVWAQQAQPQAGPPLTQTGSAESRYGLKFEPLDFKSPQVNHTELDNGITLDYFAESTIPLVTVLVRLRAGSVNDPAGKVGAAELTADVIRNGGTAALNGDELDRQLESRGAQLSVETDREETWFRLSVLKEDLPWALGILTDLLTAPALPEAKLEETRAQALVALRERFDVPMEVAQALYPQLVYGRGNPWGWTETERTIEAITTADLRAIYKKFYVSGNMKLGICGDVPWKEAQRLAGQTLGRLPRKPAPEPNVPEARPIERSRIFIVPRPATQNVVYFGHEGASRFDPLKFPIKVLNRVLAGGFTSRLFKEIRSDRGLAYAVDGQIGEGTARGIFIETALTKVESTGQVLGLMRQITAELTNQAPSMNEVELARQASINAFVFFFDTPEKIISQKIYLDGFGYPRDYLAVYTDKLKAVNPDQVREAAARHLHPERVIVMIVGQVPPELAAELAKIGPVTEIGDQELRAQWM